MKLSNRIKYYLLGFSLGLILVFFIFGTRGCEWLPNNRVLKSISSSQLYISQKNKCLLDCNSSIEKVFHLIEKGDVDFSKSLTNNRVREYYIEHEGMKLMIAIDPNDSTSTIITTNSPSKNCECKSVPNNLVPLYMPNKMALKKLSAKPLTIDSVFQCQLNCLNINKKVINKVFDKGVILMAHSYPKRKPNPSFLIELQDNDRRLLLLVKEGATKTRLKQIVELGKKNQNATNKFYQRFLNEMYFDENCPCL